jgi:hypothetical protein
MDMIRDAVIKKGRLLAVQEGIVGFLTDEVIDPKGRHHYDGHPTDQGRDYIWIWMERILMYI